MELTSEQQQAILEKFHEDMDLIKITREVFNNDRLKGSSKEGRAIREFLLEKGLSYKTTRSPQKKRIELTDKQKEKAREMALEGASSLAIAREVFPDITVKKLSNEQRSVLDFLRSMNPEYSVANVGKKGGLTTYYPPKNLGRAVKKVSEATGIELDESKLNRETKINIEALMVNMGNSRFNKIINNYTDSSDRDLFEQEFIRLTWDKPDLSADELNLYMNVCKELINLEMISSHLTKLNDLFEESETQQDITVRLAELIKAKSSEYHQCEQRIENLTKKLQGDRAERMKKRHQENASIISLVQLFQDEEERKNMVRIAELQKEAVKQEAERLESMDMWTARILGITKDDSI